MADRTDSLNGWIWADGAADPPAVPVTGTTYATASLTQTVVEDGWPYSEVVNSANFNEIMRRVTSLLSSLETYGIIPWSALTTYPVGAVVTGSDGEIYKATLTSTPASPKNPTSFSTHWEKPFSHWSPGDIKYTASATAPYGFLAANGAAISRSTYAALFAVIGTTYGIGDGSTTFNLPDLRGEFIRGLDSGRGVDAARILGSSQSATLISNQTNNNGTLFTANADSSTDYTQSFTNQNITTSTTAQKIGVRPRNVALLACIKY